MLQTNACFDLVLDDHEHLMVTALPLYHIFALTVNGLLALNRGVTSLMIANPKDIGSLITEMGRYPFDIITGVNTLYNALLNHPRFHELDFSKLRITVGGGMAVQKAVAERWQAVTGCTLAQGYGLTETSPVASLNPLTSKSFNGSIGLPLPSTRITIRNNEGEMLPTNTIGELCIQGPQVMKGYWNRIDETREVFHADGALKTGDLGFQDEAGFTTIVDRKKDMILVSGYNVYPNEVEDVVALHPGVKEVAAIGVPHKFSGEVVKIFVIKKDPNLNQQDLMSHCRAHLASHKVPRKIEFREDLPRSNVGKVLRRALREAESQS
jgi:long-chain acyl-CoA synthetase